MKQLHLMAKEWQNGIHLSMQLCPATSRNQQIGLLRQTQTGGLTCPEMLTESKRLPCNPSHQQHNHNAHNTRAMNFTKHLWFNMPHLREERASLINICKVCCVPSFVQQCLQCGLATAQLVWGGQRGEVGLGRYPAAISVPPGGLQHTAGHQLQLQPAEARMPTSLRKACNTLSMKNRQPAEWFDGCLLNDIYIMMCKANTQLPSSQQMAHWLIHLWPVAEAVAVFALPVAEVQSHDAVLVGDSQASKGAAPHIHSVLKGKVWVGGLSGVACGRQRMCSIICNGPHFSMPVTHAWKGLVTGEWEPALAGHWPAMCRGAQSTEIILCITVAL